MVNPEATGAQALNCQETVSIRLDSESAQKSKLERTHKVLLTVIILKSLIELSLMFIVARFLLGLLAGAKRNTNVFWQLLDVAAKPALWITRWVSPKLILDRHIPLAAVSWLLIGWVLVVKVKIDLCMELGAGACQ